MGCILKPSVDAARCFAVLSKLMLMVPRSSGQVGKAGSVLWVALLVATVKCIGVRAAERFELHAVAAARAAAKAPDAAADARAAATVHRRQRRPLAVRRRMVCRARRRRQRSMRSARQSRRACAARPSIPIQW